MEKVAAAIALLVVVPIILLGAVYLVLSFIIWEWVEPVWPAWRIGYLFAIATTFVIATSPSGSTGE